MFDWIFNNELLRLLGVSIGVQWVGCTAAVLLKTEKFYDLTGALIISDFELFWNNLQIKYRIIILLTPTA